MSIIIGLAIFILGAVAGFFINHVFFSSNTNQKTLNDKINKTEAELAQYKLDVSEHLDNSTQLLAQMNETCQKAMLQMESSTNLLKKATPEHIDASMPFFSQETQEQLAQTVALRHPKKPAEDTDKTVLSEPPLDYSGNPSGLFEDKTQTVTNAESS